MVQESVNVLISSGVKMDLWVLQFIKVASILKLLLVFTV